MSSGQSTPALYLHYSPGLDTPDYMLTFSGLVCTLLTLQLPEDQVDTIVLPLMDAFGLPDEARAFIFDHYLPEASQKWKFV